MLMTRGLCCLDLKQQTKCIAYIYMGFCVLGSIFGLIQVTSPQSIVGVDAFPQDRSVDPLPQPQNGTSIQVNGSTSLNVTDLNVTQVRSETNRTVSDEELVHYQLMLAHIQSQGIKLCIGSLVTFILSYMVVIGVKQEKSVLLVPWLAEQIVSMVSAFVYGLSKVLTGTLSITSSPGRILFMVVLLIFALFSVYAVLSHFVLLRKMKFHTKQIIESVLQGGSSPGSGGPFDYNPLPSSNYGQEMQPVGSDAKIRKTVLKDDDLAYFSI